MYLTCLTCGKPVSTEVPDDTVVQAVIQCPDCIAGYNSPPKPEPSLELQKLDVSIDLLNKCGDAVWRMSEIAEVAEATSDAIDHVVEALSNVRTMLVRGGAV